MPLRSWDTNHHYIKTCPPVRHTCSDDGRTDTQLPILVTAAVDAIHLRRRLNLHSDIEMSGQVVWTGKSAMDIRMQLTQVSIKLALSNAKHAAVTRLKHLKLHQTNPFSFFSTMMTAVQDTLGFQLHASTPCLCSAREGISGASPDWKASDCRRNARAKLAL